MQVLRFDPAHLSNLLHWQCNPRARVSGQYVFWIRATRHGSNSTTALRYAPPPAL